MGFLLYALSAVCVAQASRVIDLIPPLALLPVQNNTCSDSEPQGSPQGFLRFRLLEERFLRLRSLEKQNSLVLFVLHDAGETLALLPVVQQMLKGTLPRSRLLVLPLGQPATNMTLCLGHYNTPDCRANMVPSVTLKELGIKTDIIDSTAGRNQLLPDEEFRSFCDQFSGKASAVVAGFTYAMQRQIGVGLQQRGARFAAYYDGLSVVGTDGDVPSGLQMSFAQVADEVWVPSLKLRPNGSEWTHEGTRWYGVGQPTLQTWAELSNDTAAIREARLHIYGEHALNSGAPAALWFGGYGKTYSDALRIWSRAVKQMSVSGSPRGLLFALATHPGPYGDVDRQILHEEGVSDLVPIVPSDIAGAVAALASNLTVSQGSTGGEQSLFAGKPALFVDPVGSAFGTHLGSVLGLIPTANTSLQVVKDVEKVAAEQWAFDRERLAASGVPLHSTQEIAERVLLLLGCVAMQQ
eukprot:TRINITY_DN30434_c0_g2_i1.p1 TRINITY_DN30434_c0_g2~~TRINITY_DN30434_c0_g2_i1.p1  ORF type:complete len:478 (+),score=47.98 TRINITY_DN30434_c0_g2_i1:39-1436(+)